MKIKNTDGAYCKIKDIKITGLHAYVTLILYSSKPQVSEDANKNIHRVFSFYLRDKGASELYKLSPNNYWIDRTNNYNTDSTNIDVNMYKEVILNIDITNSNRSEMVLDRWVRHCNIVMLEHTITQQEAWVSEDLELLSKSIELPTIKNFKVSLCADNIISVYADLLYESQEDFKYISKNIITTIDIISEYSGKIQESLDFDYMSEEYIPEQLIRFVSLNEYTEPITVNISIKNLKGEVLKRESKFFNPTISNIPLYINTNGVSKVNSIAYKKSDSNIQKVIRINKK